jgi:hypothetical protein
MAWAALTFDDLRDRLGSTEIEALLAESPTPDDKVNEVLSQIAADVVSRVNAGRRKRGLAPVVNSGRYVPTGAKRHAYTLARRLMTDAFPSLAEYNGDDRKLAVEEAENYLDDLANNNADGDDDGALSFVSATGTSFRYGGKAVMDFAESP